MSPIFDIHCYNCSLDSTNVMGTHELIRCPICTSYRTLRKWTGDPVTVMVGDPQGSTRGVRRKAQEITKKTRK